MTQGPRMWHHNLNPNYSRDRALVCTLAPFCLCILDSKTGEYYRRGLTAVVIFFWLLSIELHLALNTQKQDKKRKKKCASLLGPFWNLTTMKCHSLTLYAITSSFPIEEYVRRSKVLKQHARHTRDSLRFKRSNSRVCVFHTSQWDDWKL